MHFVQTTQNFCALGVNELLGVYFNCGLKYYPERSLLFVAASRKYQIASVKSSI